MSAANDATLARLLRADDAAVTTRTDRPSFDIVIVGAGIVGLATGLWLLDRSPELRLAILNKEATVAAHQTGHNTGVLHSSLHYAPGSAKARLCPRSPTMPEKRPGSRCGGGSAGLYTA